MKKKSKLFKRIFVIWLGLCLVTLIGFWIWFPSVDEIKGCITTNMYNVELCPTSKNYVPLSKISRFMQNAVIITEDSGFFKHKGFDEEGIQHCFEKLKQTRRIVCGGSTITQQLAKNMFLSKDKNFLRKGIEALITIKIEKTLTKKEILERYLNVVQFGKNIFGIKQAAQFYFKKQPSQLDANEAAFLAMVLPNPEKYSQSFYRKNLTKFARNRINRIVNNLHRFGRLDSLAYEEAIGNVDYFLKGEKAPTKEDESGDAALESELAAGDISDEELEKLLDDSKAESEKNHKPAAPIDTKEEELIEEALEKEIMNKNTVN